MKLLPWSLCAAAVVLIAWLALALVKVENQRNALASQTCAEADAQCQAAHARQHWWQHFGYALTHVRQ